MTALDAIHTLRSLLATNADPANTRCEMLSFEEGYAVALGLDALECVYINALQTPADPGVSVTEPGAESARSVPTPQIAFDSGSVAVTNNHLRGQDGTGPLSFSEINQECGGENHD